MDTGESANPPPGDGDPEFPTTIVTSEFTLGPLDPIHVAAIGGDANAVQQLMEAEIARRRLDLRDRKPGFRSSFAELHAEKVTDAVWIDKVVTNYHDLLPLHVAALEDSAEVVTFLLDGGVDIDWLSRESMTALHFGAIGANVAMVKMLFERGADISARNSNRNSILSYTGMGGSVELFDWLMDFNFPDDRNLAGLRVGHWAAIKSRRELLRHMVVDVGYDIEQIDKFGRTTLYSAACWGSEDVFDLLIDLDADTQPEPLFWGPLHWCCYKGRPMSMVRKCLDLGNDPLTIDHGRRTMLHLSVAGGNLEVIDYMLNNYDISIDALDNSGHTPAVWALATHPEIVQHLLDKGASAMCGQDMSEPLIGVAAGFGAGASIRVLAAAGSDIESQAPDGSRPLTRAIMRGRLPAVTALVDLGASLYAADGNGRTVFDALDDAPVKVPKGNGEDGDDDDDDDDDEGVSPDDLDAIRDYLNRTLTGRYFGAIAGIVFAPDQC